MSTRVSVVILNFNGEGYLKKFLPSVINYSQGAEIVVADNCSSDGSLALLQSEFASVRTIVMDENHGFAGGYNRALEMVDNEIVVLLNSDVEVSEGWLAPLVDYLDKHPNTAAVMPKVLCHHDKTLFEHAGAAGGYIDLWGFAFCRGRIGETLERDQGQYDDCQQVFWATGAAMVIRRKAYFEAGGLDSDFFAHMEEIDLSWRLQSLGYELAVVPSSKVWHVGGGALPYNSPRKSFLNFRNSLYMLYKNLPTAYLFPIIFTRLCIDGILGVRYLIRGEQEHFKSVIKAHFAFYEAFSKLEAKRNKQQQSLPAKLYRGSILYRYVFESKTFKGMKI